MLSLHLSPTTTFSLLKSNPQKPTNQFFLQFHPSSSSSSSFSKLDRLPFATVSAAPTMGPAVAVEEELPPGLRHEAMPRHVAVIMDGNVRWARQRGLPSGAGHEAGVRSLRRMVELCGKWGVKVLTVFAFSYDNWVRPQVEVDFLMSLFERGIKSELDNFIRQGIRISVIGDTSKLPKSLQKLIADAEETTKDYTNFTKDYTNFQLIVAVSYSGKYDIIQACKNISQKVKDGAVEVEEIDEGLIEQELETNCTEYPYPDLLIRTSGELRVSNFLLWQLAYTELFFVRALWPDFGEEEFIEALMSYQQRSRRYGGRDLQESSANSR
ncbi:LOW QUALITY PROTEIN: dehydrodolichyl diphosphate synthase 2-like [Chenopodium quinoa]|uniref:LOW QUALITY PROTEIN: dehydrodolichyl diphosphate synthase 2-like n=1 Tax=Chenopodium quinoa TaxID=63459 RepID=UPI000B773844|nr:LOW QUALITY PROTEIN: dehydrodolichyl diphosphate synthase 2-like [Chenopodium quinoa]